MSDAVIKIAFCTYVLALLVNIKAILRIARRLPGEQKSLCIAWTFLFVGLGVFFLRTSNVTGVGAMDASAWYQVACVALGSLIVFILAIRKNTITHIAHAPVFLLFVYALLAVISASYSPTPALTFYKGSLLLLDVFIMCVALVYLREPFNSTVLLDLTFLLVGFFVAGALFGAITNPATAFLQSDGALGLMLQGTYPYMNPNELGFLSAVVAIVGYRRFFDANKLTTRFYWGSLFIISLTTLFLAQARTSLVGMLIGVALISYGIKKLRAVAVFVTLVMLGLLGYDVLDSQPADWKENVQEYAQRGQSEGGFQSLVGRYERWVTAGSAMFDDSPILGHGFDAGVRYGANEFGLSHTHMHNAHVQIIANSGLAGYIPWLLMVMIVTWRVVHRLLARSWPAVNESDRYHIEITAILALILLRTITGQVLVTHQWSLMIFIGIVVFCILRRFDPNESKTKTKPKRRNRYSHRIKGRGIKGNIQGSVR